MTKVIKAIRTSEGDHQYDYESLANIPVAVPVATTLTTDVINGQESREFDISSYLPNDGCNYLVSLLVYAECTGLAKVYVWCSTDLFEDDYVYNTLRFSWNSSENGSFGSQCQVLVGPKRILKFTNSGGAASNISKFTVRISHYIKAS